ncbi:MAG: DUF6760 family protein [Cyanobacteria bacterium P01_H01_bin.121]
MSYPSQQLAEEVAYLSSQVHWSLAEILSLEHRDRRYWIERVKELQG